MAFGPWTPTAAFVTKLATGQFDLDSDALKVALFQSTSNLSTASTTYASVTDEVANGNGYTTGGVAVLLALTGTTVVNVAFVTNPSWIAAGGSIAARYAGLYEVGGDVMAICLLDDTPADVVTTDGNVLTIDNDGTPYPILTITTVID